MRKAISLAAATAAFAVVGVGHALAANWTVALGEQTRPPKGTPKGATLDQFMPNRLVINAGDKVTFSSASFHTATYLGNKKPPGLFVPDPAHGKYTGINDAAGNPFYFDGLAKLIYSTVAFLPAGGKSVDGTAYTSSGALTPMSPKQKVATATYTFPKAGTFHLVCNVHPGMKMDVVVKPVGAAVALSPTQVKAKILTDQSAGWAKAKQLAAAQHPPAKTVYVGVGGNVAFLAYFPKTITVKSGTTINFVNRSPSEVHDVAFGPGKWRDAFQMKYDLFPFGPKNQVSPVLPYGTEPKGKYQYDGKNHGNGFFVTPLTAGNPKVPLPHASKVTFTAPGRYKYICLIHGPDMSGTVVVTQ